MKIGALAGWFGGKRTLAARIVAEFGDHAAYWEPFAGSMAVLFAKSPCRMETVNDLHNDVINLARVVRFTPTARELYQRARLVLCSDSELADASNTCRADFSDDGLPDIDRALTYLITCWQGRNGECGLADTERGRSLCIRWTNNGGAPGTRWHGAVRSIAAWHRRLKHVTITCRDGFKMLEKIADEPSAVIYCDPPYLEKSDKYKHDFTDDDHARLSQLLHRFKQARVVLSYYDNPALAELYPAWTRRRIEVNKALSNTNTVKRAVEVLLINGPSYVESEQADLFTLGAG